ncbi:MAG: hypothetical protein HFJ27_05405, partial [Clostridia bacterium]|nr:hypothetical protein [Clostridia bacterium]
MKKKQIISTFTLIVIMFFTSIVQAITLDIGIVLPKDYKQNPIQNEKNHIYLYATNETKDESVMIVQLENELTNQIDNLNVLSTEELDSFIKQYNQLKNKENQTILKQETYKAKENLFIDTIFETTVEGKKLQQEEYYTIVEKKAIIVSANFLGKEIDTEKIRNMIDNMIISSNEENTKNDTIFLWGIVISTILLTIIYVIKQRNNKPNLNDNEKGRLLQNVKEHLENSIEFDKFKGILILFAITISLNVIGLTLGSIQGLVQYKIQYSIMDKTYTSLTILQNVIQLLGILCIAYLLTKKKEQTIKKIKQIFVGMFIGVMLLTV